MALRNSAVRRGKLPAASSVRAGVRGFRCHRQMALVLPHPGSRGGRWHASSSGARYAMAIPKTIVVPTDFSELSEEALAYASELATALGATLHIVHVVDELAGRFVDGPDCTQLGRLQTTLERSARDRIDALVAAENTRHRRAIGAMLTSRFVAESIVSYARLVHADLIVMGAHGRNAAWRLFLGTVAERVVRSSPCPVLTIRGAVRHENAIAVEAAAHA